MPRRKYASKDFTPPSPERRETQAGGAPGPRRVAGTQSYQPAPEWAVDSPLENLVQWASNRNDGWLRIVPASSGEVHWKWRFTSGRWEGHYIYWLQAKMETAASAFKGLAGKLDLVDAGHLKPSRDVY